MYATFFYLCAGQQRVPGPGRLRVPERPGRGQEAASAAVDRALRLWLLRAAQHVCGDPSSHGAGASAQVSRCSVQGVASLRSGATMQRCSCVLKLVARASAAGALWERGIWTTRRHLQLRHPPGAPAGCCHAFVFDDAGCGWLNISWLCARCSSVKCAALTFASNCYSAMLNTKMSPARNSY